MEIGTSLPITCGSNSHCWIFLGATKRQKWEICISFAAFLPRIHEFDLCRVHNTNKIYVCISSQETVERVKRG